MEGKSQNATGSSSVPETGGGHGQETVTVMMDLFRTMIKSLNPNIDADLLLAQTGVMPIPPPAIEEAASKGVEESATGSIEKALRNLSTSDAEVAEKSTEKGEENPTEEANQEKEVPTAAREEGRKKSTPRKEAVKARAATVHIYQRRQARVEGGNEKRGESVVEPPRCRRRLILADEPDETEEEVVVALIEALPSSRQLNPPTEIVDPERERRERKSKGKLLLNQ